LSPVRLGLVGCGRIAERGYLPALARVRAVELVAVADPVEARCASAAPGIPCYESASALLAETAVDAIVLATPAAAHLADARVAARAGVPTLVEKPPAPSLRDAAELAALDPPPWIGFNRRFVPGLARLRTDSPAAAPADLTLEFRYERSDWRPHAADDEALLDLGTHLVDLSRWLTGQEVARARARRMDEAHAAFELELEHGGASISCATDETWSESVESRDEAGRLVGRYSTDDRRAFLLSRLLPNRRYPLVTSLAAQLEALAEAVRGGAATPLATAADGLAVMAVLEAVRQSAVGGYLWRSVPPC
jgi:predicted dehydrogenase